MKSYRQPHRPSGVALSRRDMLAATTFTLLSTAVLPLAAQGAEESTVPSGASLNTLFSARDWLNGAPTREHLRGKVVLVDVFTFDCINCKNITPNLRKLSRRNPQDLALVGIHSPETPIERDRNEVVRHLATLGVTWPVAIDNDFALWKAYNIEYWPTQMIFDRRGKLRKVVIGDSEDALVNDTIDALMRERA
jgi:thiol-disulfide isomerase/thioredoxin